MHSGAESPAALRLRQRCWHVKVPRQTLYFRRPREAALPTRPASHRSRDETPPDPSDGGFVRALGACRQASVAAAAPGGETNRCQHQATQAEQRPWGVCRYRRHDRRNAVVGERDVGHQTPRVPRVGRVESQNVVGIPRQRDRLGSGRIRRSAVVGGRGRGCQRRRVERHPAHRVVHAVVVRDRGGRQVMYGSAAFTMTR